MDSLRGYILLSQIVEVSTSKPFVLYESGVHFVMLIVEKLEIPFFSRQS